MFQMGAEIIIEGFKKAGIGSVLHGTVVLLSEDPFEEFNYHSIISSI